MNVQERLNLLVHLGNYMQSDSEEWNAAKHQAHLKNQWFIPQFIELSVKNICEKFLQKQTLQKAVGQYKIEEPVQPKTVGIVMAGNIPLVGFHDFLCVFLSGHHAAIKLSSKDDVLLPFLLEKMNGWNEEFASYVTVADTLKNCDAYIATGSNNSSRYFEYYFAKYPHIIRKNKTSVAVLDGAETKEELSLLADDVSLYFGLGCRNVTKLFVPEGYDFIPLLEALKKYDYFLEFHKYKNNYDYQLALLIMSNKFYMNNGSVLLAESASPFAPVSQLNFSYYNSLQETVSSLQNSNDIQCIVGHHHTPFGNAQTPCFTDFADGTDTLQFLMNL